MRSTNWLPIVALTTGLLLGASTTGLTQTTPPTQPPAQRPARPGGAHPHIMGAERALHHASRQLEEAAHDYGGHRAKALELVRAAEGELREAIAYAQSHPAEFATAPTR